MNDKPTTQRLSRRSFAGALLSGSIVVGYNALTGTWVLAAQAARQQPFAKLPPLDGALSIDDATRAAYAQDYGQIVHERPLAVLKPGSVRDIARMVRFARRFGLRIAARGQGHQSLGQAQVRDGIVIDMRSLHEVHGVGDATVDVDAGIEWRRLIQATLPHGLMPPVLTAYLGLTVGGTLSIGGVGTTSFRYGAQVDQVDELQVVTGEGDVVSCSERRNRALFYAALAGQGQVAIITRAVLRQVAAPTDVREYVLPYRDLATCVRDGVALVEDGRFDGVVALLAPTGGEWTFALALTKYFDAPNAPDDAPLLAGLHHVAGSERIRTVPFLVHADAIPAVEFGPSHPDGAYFVPGSAALQFIQDALPRLSEADLGEAASMRLFFWKHGPFTRPLFRIPTERTFVYLAMLRAEASDADTVARMLRGNRELFDQNRAAGGAHYPFGAVDLSRRDWQQHYGEWWSALAAAKRRSDPDNVLASGPDLFVRQERG